MNGGRVEGQAGAYSLSLPGGLRGYGNAQIDDYAGLSCILAADQAPTVRLTDLSDETMFNDELGSEVSHWLLAGRTKIFKPPGTVDAEDKEVVAYHPFSATEAISPMLFKEATHNKLLKILNEIYLDKYSIIYDVSCHEFTIDDLNCKELRDIVGRSQLPNLDPNRVPDAFIAYLSRDESAFAARTEACQLAWPVE